MWLGDKINNLYLGSETIERGTQGTKIRVLIGTKPPRSAHKITTTDSDSALSEYGVSNAWKSAGTALVEKLRVCTETRTLQEPLVLTHVFKRMALFTTGISSRQIIGQKGFFSAAELVYTSVQISSGICITWPPMP